MLTSVTDLDLSDDEMSVDGDSFLDGGDPEQLYETMRSEADVTFNDFKQQLGH